MKRIFANAGSIIIVLASGLMACSEKTELQNAPDVPGLTSVITYAPEFVTPATATLRGSVEMDVAGRISETGIYLYAQGTPSFDSTGLPVFTEPDGAGLMEKIVSSSVSEGEFHVSLTGLTPATSYRYVAFVSNDAGTFFGSEKFLVTSYSTVSDAEGNVYQTVRIGDQIWMRENLKAKIYSDKACISGCYDLRDDPEFGKRYSWSAANRATPGGKSVPGGGACPVGWHVPGDREWQEMLTYIGVRSGHFKEQLNSIDIIGDDQAVMLKDAAHNRWTDDRITNKTGFSVLPADICSGTDDVSCVKTAFWTSSPGVFYGFQTGSEKIVRGYNTVYECGFSVRCVKDKE